MKNTFLHPRFESRSKRSAFSLIEVVLAIGIFLITVLALVGLLGPTLQSVDEVEKTDEVSSVVNTINAFLQSSPDIAERDGTGTITKSKFDVIYDSIYYSSEGFATILVFRQYGTDDEISLKVGFVGVGPTAAQVTSADVGNLSSGILAAGPVYRAVLTPSSVTPSAHVTDNGEDQFPRYTLTKELSAYTEGYFAMEVRIYAENVDDIFNVTTNLEYLQDKAEPIFTYNTAVVR